MDVGYGQLLEVLSALHPELSRTSLIARLQYLQRDEFPVGKPDDAARTDYGAGGLMKLALAFELLAAGAPPGVVVSLVNSGWGSAGTALAAAWTQRGKRLDAIPLFVRINGIGPKRRDAGEIAAGTADDIRQWLQGRGGGRRVLLVDAMRLGRSVGEAVEQLGAGAEAVITSLDHWADEVRRAGHS